MPRILRKVTGANDLILVLIPEGIYMAFFQKHIARQAANGVATCIVTAHNDYEGKPTDEQIMSMLAVLVANNPIKAGEFNYAIAPTLGLYCRNFKCDEPLTNHRNGFMRMNLVSAGDGIRTGIKLFEEYSQYEACTDKARAQINAAAEWNYRKKIIFIAQHLNPV